MRTGALDVILNNWKRFLTLFLILLPAYTISRLFFLTFNWEAYHVYSWGELFSSLLHGIRFDLSAICYVNIFFVLLTFIPVNLLGNWIYRGVVLLVNFSFLSLGLIDTEYYKFVGTRFNSSVFLYTNEIKEQSFNFIFIYWYILLFGFALFWGIAKSYRLFMDVFVKSRPRRSWEWGWLLVFLCLYVMVMRGGWQSRVLMPMDAHKGGVRHELAILSLNSAHTLFRTKARGTVKATYFSNDQEAIDIIRQSPLSGKSLGRGEGQKNNVVIIILESFSTAFWGSLNGYEGYTPFLDTLVRKGTVFQNHFANGRRSIDALFTVLFGVPSLMDAPVAKSSYQANQWYGLGQIFGDAGYSTSFFHGSKRGTMYFSAISMLAGLQDYHPLERYPYPERDHNGSWGIYDEPFFQYMVSELGKQEVPFLSVLFTLSTHEPCKTPPEKEGMFRKGNMPIHECVGYVDDALRQFFEEAQKKDWYKDTLFVITADHIQFAGVTMPEYKYSHSTLGYYRVPLLFYHPSRRIHHSDPNRVAQHADILPTLMDLLDLKVERWPLFGRSLFGPEEGEALLHSNGSFLIVQRDYFLQFIEATGETYLYKSDDILQKNPVQDQEGERERLLTRLKAYLQYYRNGLIKNFLYDWEFAPPSPKIKALYKTHRPPLTP